MAADLSLSKILHDIRNLYTDHYDDWYIFTIVAICAMNHPKDVLHVYSLVEQAIGESTVNDKDEATAQAVLRMREAILKSFIVTGFPKAINGLRHLAEATPPDILKRLPASPLRKQSSWQDIRQSQDQGLALFSKIYDRHTDRVLNQMHSSYPDLAQTALHQLYPLLSYCETIGARETSLIMVTGLLVGNLPDQLRGHTYGALHNGATLEQIDRIKTLVTLLGQHYHEFDNATISKL